MPVVIDKPVSGSRPAVSMSAWSGRQEEMMAMIGSLNQSLVAEFRDRDIEPATLACCSCASGQMSGMNFCKHER